MGTLSSLFSAPLDSTIARILFGPNLKDPTSQLVSLSNSPVKNPSHPLLPPVVSGRGTYPFPVVLHLRRRFVTSGFLSSYFNYCKITSPVTGWPTSALAWLSQRLLFNWSLADSLSGTNILFFFLFLPFSPSPEISFPFFFNFSFL